MESIVHIDLHEGRHIYVCSEDNNIVKISSDPSDLQLLPLILNIQLLLNGKYKVSLEMGNSMLEVCGDVLTFTDNAGQIQKYKCLVDYSAVFTQYYQYLCSELLETQLYATQCNKRYILSNTLATDIARAIQNNPDITPATLLSKL